MSLVHLKLDLLCELFIKDESLFEYLVESVVAEVQGDSSVYGQIFPLVDISHLKDHLVHCV